MTYWLFKLTGLDPFLSLPLTMLALFALGYVLQRTLINRVVRGPILLTFLLTFGISLIIADLVLHAFSADFRTVTVPYDAAGLRLGGAIIPYARAGALLTAVLLVLALAAFLNRTRWEQGILATGMDPTAARLVGIRVGRT